jgi:pantoate--beta-alanine ligase
VVSKLFNQVRPDFAVFGEKDYQQLLVIRRMVEDLAMSVEIIGVPTVREADGLAMSSRNGYLSAEDRQRAPALYRALVGAARSLLEESPIEMVERDALATLSESGLIPDYVKIRMADDLRPATAADGNLVILAAAYLGRARLIDNLRVCRDGRSR